MEMHQVRYFLAVSRTLNFTQAADECHVAQPSLSRAIKKLEEELGGDLFRRERGLTHLTELGRLTQPLLQQCFDSAQAAKTLASSYRKGTSSPLRLALSHTVAMHLLVRPLTELIRAFPGLELKFFRGTAEAVDEQLKLGAAELGIACPIAHPWERLESWVLFRERFELAVNRSHPLAMQNAVTLADLANVRLLPRSYCEQAAALDELLDTHGIAHAQADSIGSDHDLVALLQANVGVSVMPASANISADLRFLEVHDVTIERPVVLYAASGRERSPAANGLLKLLRSADWSATRSRSQRPPAGDAAAADPRGSAAASPH